ncbi:MAG: peptidoglycan-binding domain-containing protein [Candidatus Doudnabacteria bacterium]
MAILVLAGGKKAAADTNSTNFDGFTLGDLNGQDGWTSGHGSSTCPLYDVAVVPNTAGFANFGTQSLRISNAITCGSFNDQTFSKSLADEAGETLAGSSAFSGGTRQPYFEAQWDFASTVPGSEQPGLSVVASPDRGDTMRMSWLQMQDTPAGLQLNFEDYQHSISNFVLTPIATGIDRTVPHTVKITMQFIDGAENDIVNVYLDGVLIHTGTSWEDYFRDFAGGIPFPVDSIMFRVAGTAAPATLGNGFLIDNFSSFSGPVPVPGGVPASASSGPVPVPPMIDVVKVPSPLALPAGPGPVIYNYTVRNIGTVPMTTVTLTDDSCSPLTLVSGDANNNGALDANETWVYTCTTTLTATQTNTVTATGFANGLSTTDTATATVVVGAPGLPNTGVVIPPLIHVTKIPSPMSLPVGGGMIAYSYTVTNPGIVALSNVNLIDNTCSPLSDPSGDANSNNLLDVSETWSYACRTNLKTTTTNTATATGTANGITATDSASVTVIVSVPGLSALPVVPGFPNTGTIQMNKTEANTIFRRSLGTGARGADVKALQTVLVQKGFLRIPAGVAYGFYGQLTRAAVKKYQANTGLPQVGVFGPLTRAKLISELGD